MKTLILIGASGYGRDIAEKVMMLPEYNKDLVLKGFLVHKKEYLHSLDNYTGYPPILGLIDDYDIQENDVFLCTLGDVWEKKNEIMKLKNRGANFYTLVHPNAFVSKDAEIGEGTIVCEMASIGSGAKIGSFCLINISSVIGHGDIVGDFSRIDSHVVCVGNVEVGNCVTIHTSAVINHGVKLGNGSVIGACSFVIRKVSEGVTVCGNPARILNY